MHIGRPTFLLGKVGKWVEIASLNRHFSQLDNENIPSFKWETELVYFQNAFRFAKQKDSYLQNTSSLMLILNL